MTAHILDYVYVAIVAIVLVSAFVGLPWLLDRVVKGSSAFLVPAVLLGGALFCFATAPGEFGRAETFERTAVETDGIVTRVEERRSGTGASSTDFLVYHVEVRDGAGASRSFELPDTRSGLVVDDQVTVFVLGDDAHWDREFSPYWWGPWARILIGLGLLAMGIPITVTAVRAFRKRG